MKKRKKEKQKSVQFNMEGVRFKMASAQFTAEMVCIPRFAVLFSVL